MVVPDPRVHLPVAVPSLLGELVPGLGFGEELADCSLAEAQHVLGEQALPDVVHRQQLSHPGKVP